MGIRHRLAQAAVAVALVAGVAVTAAGPAAAGPATAAQTCAQLQATVNHLETLAAHVPPGEARDKLLDQADAVLAQMEAQGCFNSTLLDFDGTFTFWTTAASGPSSARFDIPLVLYPSGEVGWTLPTMSIGGVTINSNGAATGTWSADGHVTLSTPIVMHTTEVGAGNGTLFLSTDGGINTTGDPVDGVRLPDPRNGGVITLVGITTFRFANATLPANIAMDGVWQLGGHQAG